MVWQESESGTWLDEFDGAEKVFYGMSQAFKTIGKEHGSVHAICKINTKRALIREACLESLILNAWKALRFDFPALGVFVEDSKKKYLATTHERMELWTKDTFHVSMTGSASKIVPTLHLRKLPCLFFLPQSSEVIFHSSHWRIDALGACMVLDRLFYHVSRGTTDDYLSCGALEHQNLSPSLEDAYGSPKDCTPAMQSMAEAVRRRNFETSYPTAGLPFDGDIATPPTLSRPHAIEFTVEATRDLIAACKSGQISLTAAIHAACSDVVFDRSKNNDPDYSTIVSVNMRGQLPAPYNDKSHACSTYVTGITHTVHRENAFAARSRQLTKAYKGDWNIPEYMSALRTIYKVHGEALQAVAKAGTRAPMSNVTVSSLGIVDKYLRSDHGSVMIERFHLGSAIMNRQMTLYIWTFRDHLTISLDSNEAYHTTEAAD